MISAADIPLPRFEFATAARIIFGAGTIREIGSATAPHGSRAMLAYGVPDLAMEPVRELLRAVGLDVFLLRVEGEPRLDGILEAVRQATAHGCEVIVGLGGGSALDTAKAVAALASNPGNPMDYLEVVGKGLPLVRPAWPCIAAPTTAGTGAEVTRNAVIGIPDRKIKVSLRSAWMLPRTAIIDPQLTVSLPPAVTAYTGMDALTQVLEPFVCARPNPLSDGFCRDGLRRAARSLRAAYLDGADLSARGDMSLVSLYGGLALANAGLGAAHGFAAPLGGMLAAPHGALCARLLPAVMDANLRALRQRDSESPALPRYTEAAGLLCGRAGAPAEAGAAWVRQLVEDLRIPRLCEWGLTVADIDSTVEKAAQASSMKANPIQLTTNELTGILKDAL